jgi:hypothetical protein
VKKIVSKLLVFLFFAGQVNLAWASHYCEDILVSSNLTLNTSEHDCCGSSSKSPMDCCEDEIARADADDFFEKSDIKTQISPEFFLALVVTFSGLNSFSPDYQSPIDYFPDLPIPDIHLLHQTFLI